MDSTMINYVLNLLKLTLNNLKNFIIETIFGKWQKGKYGLYYPVSFSFLSIIVIILWGISAYLFPIFLCNELGFNASNKLNLKSSGYECSQTRPRTYSLYLQNLFKLSVITVITRFNNTFGKLFTTNKVSRQIIDKIVLLVLPLPIILLIFSILFTLSPLIDIPKELFKCKSTLMLDIFSNNATFKTGFEWMNKITPSN